MKHETLGDTRGAAEKGARACIVRRHLRLGWWSLALFLVLGATLESLHGLKVSWYLDVGQDTRRLMWRLAHAHGTLLALVQVAFAATVHVSAADGEPWTHFVSRALIAAGVLLPLGFFLGGLVVYGGDPWVGVLLVPLGALALFAGVVSTARQLGRR